MIPIIKFPHIWDREFMPETGNLELEENPKFYLLESLIDFYFYFLSDFDGIKKKIDCSPLIPHRIAFIT